jgi:hypothetical protein
MREQFLWGENNLCEKNNLIHCAQNCAHEGTKTLKSPNISQLSGDTKKPENKAR